MKVEIIAVGSEILLGDIVNTNAAFLSRELAALGLNVHYQSVVGDNPQRLEDAFRLAFSRADMVITSGGLGPTDDDLTKEIGAKFFNREMYLDKECEKKLRSFFEGRNMPVSNMKQAYMPVGSVPIENPYGTAPSCMLEDNGKVLIMLPGPPNELERLFVNKIGPLLLERFCDGKTIVSERLRLYGIGEGKVGEAVRDLMNGLQNPTLAPYAKPNAVELRLTARADSKDECQALIAPVKKEIYNRLGDFIYAEGEVELSEAVMKSIIERSMTIATAESCTGGMVASRLIDYSGASQAFLNGVVSYSNEAKINMLGVNKETLDKYGAVSEQVAEEMCRGVARVSGADIGLSTTGVAGPLGGTEEKPVGLVYIGVYIKDRVTVKELRLKGDRMRIRSRAVNDLLWLLNNCLKDIGG